MSRKCILNCPKGVRLHKFPKDSARREQWLSILGIKTSTKAVYVCGRHFPEVYIFNGRISKHAIPFRKAYQHKNDEDMNRLENELQMAHDNSLPLCAESTSKHHLQDGRIISKSSVPDVANVIEEYHGQEKIDKFEYHENVDVHKLVDEIILEYFGDEPDQASFVFASTEWHSNQFEPSAGNLLW